MTKLAERLRSLRLANHRTQTEVAVHIGITLNGYANLEYGKTVNLKMSHAKKLAELYGISVNEIYGGAGSRELAIREAMDEQPEVMVGVAKNMMEQIQALKVIVEEQRKTIEDLRYIIEQLKR
jgi:transcriptional regulator with XRE-family HTH domain